MPRRNLYLLIIIVLFSCVCYERSNSAKRSRYRRMYDTFCEVMDRIENNYVKKGRRRFAVG